MKPEINIFKTENEMHINAAEKICSLINAYTNKHNRCSFVLSGGDTPKKLYDILSSDHKEKIEWNKVFFFWGDERCVPPDNDESNFKMANNHLLSKIPVPETNIFRIPAEKPHDEAAAKYEVALKNFFEGETLPTFDIMLLGIGSDGHTASLFPGTDALYIKDKWVHAVYIGKLKSWRITLTFPVINNSKNILIIGEGKGKSKIINKILYDKTANLPAQKVNPVNGNVIWYLDREALPFR
ncbi:MAG TPA: 6-phosphogluconolactonase [Ignavibacteria bacterium]